MFLYSYYCNGCRRFDTVCVIMNITLKYFLKRFCGMFLRNFITLTTAGWWEFIWLCLVTCFCQNHVCCRCLLFLLFTIYRRNWLYIMFVYIQHKVRMNVRSVFVVWPFQKHDPVLFDMLDEILVELNYVTIKLCLNWFSVPVIFIQFKEPRWSKSKPKTQFTFILFFSHLARCQIQLVLSG